MLQYHGTADSVVPYEQGRRLFEAAPATSSTGIPKRFVTIEGGQHNFVTVGDIQVELRELVGRLREG